MTSTNAYETLYKNMKSKFTVVSENSEYTLGEYMLKKANPNENVSNLPATKTESQNRSLSAIFSYVNEKLTVKKQFSFIRIRTRVIHRLKKILRKQQKPMMY